MDSHLVTWLAGGRRRKARRGERLGGRVLLAHPPHLLQAQHHLCRRLQRTATEKGRGRTAPPQTRAVLRGGRLAADVQRACGLAVGHVPPSSTREDASRQYLGNISAVSRLARTRLGASDESWPVAASASSSPCPRASAICLAASAKGGSLRSGKRRRQSGHAWDCSGTVRAALLEGCARREVWC